MAVFLLTEMQKKKDDSSYKSPVDAYLALLSDDTNFPCCYSDEELNMLQGSALQEQINWRRQGLQDDYDLICKTAPDMNRFNYKEFLRVSCLV